MSEQQTDPVVLAAGRSQSLGSRMRRGLLWSLLNTVIGRTGTLLAGIVIARVLTQEDFGVFAVALVVLSATLSINELGVSVAILRWQGDPARIAPTVASLSVLASSTLYVGIFFAAPWIAATLGAPAATGVIRLLCIGVLIDALSAVPAAQLVREFRQRARFAVDTTNFVISTSVTITLALLGHGAWSLAWGRLAGNLVSAVILLVLAPGQFRLGLNREVLAPLLRFGLPLAGSNLVVVGMINLDKAVTGHVLGPVALGVYVLAFNLSSWPVNVLSVTVQPIAIPGFAQLLDDPDRLRRTVERGYAALLTGTLLVSIPLAVLSEPVIRFVYGQKWIEAAGVLQVLAIFGAVRVVMSLLYDLMVAAGRTRQSLWVQTCWVLALAPALYVGARLYGITGVAWAQVAVAVLVVLPLSVVAVRPVGLSIRGLLRVSVRPVLAGAALLALTMGLRSFAMPDPVLLVTSAVAGTALYGGLTWPTWRQLLGDARKARRRPA